MPTINDLGPIKNAGQLRDYSQYLQELLTKPVKSEKDNDDIEHLGILIEFWNKKNVKVEKAKPHDIVRGLLAARGLKDKHLLEILGLSSKGHVSEILNGTKKLSSENIAILATYFHVPQELLNPVEVPEPVNKATEKELKNSVVAHK